jgi:hypothetical protein
VFGCGGAAAYAEYPPYLSSRQYVWALSSGCTCLSRSVPCHRRGVSEPKRRNRAKTGKRSDDAYTQVTLLIPEELRRQLKAAAALQGRDMSTLAEEAIRAYLAQSEAS